MARDYAKLIGHLIAKAESAQELGSDAEAASYRAKAEELMREYRISEEETIATDQFGILPQRFEIVLLESNGYLNAFRQDYMELWYDIARHAGLKSRVEFRWEDGHTSSGSRYEACKLVAVGYGYEMDVKLAEFYYTSARLVFMTRIDAKVNPELSDQENCYFLRNSGMKRNDIALKLWGSALNDGAAHGKVQKLYLAECTRRDEKPRVSGRGIQVDLYRTAYANAFVSEFGWRLADARTAADSKGGALALPGRAERVAEAFYTEWPDMRPETPEERAARQAKADAAAPYICQDCLKTKSVTGQCRVHRPRTATAADYRRWDRESNGPEARAGRAAGAAAARSVNVQRTAGERTAKAESAPQRTALGG